MGGSYLKIENSCSPSKKHNALMLYIVMWGQWVLQCILKNLCKFWGKLKSTKIEPSLDLMVHNNISKNTYYIKSYNIEFL